MKSFFPNSQARLNGIFALFILFALSSCSGVTDIQKRHYRKGFYVNRANAWSKQETLPVFQKREAAPLATAPTLPEAQKEFIQPLQNETAVQLVEAAAQPLKTKKKQPASHVSCLKSHVSSQAPQQEASSKKTNTATQDDPEKEKNHSIAGIIFAVAGLLVILGIVLLPMEVAGLVFVAAGAALVAGLSYFFKKTQKQKDADDAKAKAEPEEEETASHADIAEERKIDRIGKRVAIAFGIAFGIFALACLALIAYLIFAIGSGGWGWGE